MSRLTLITTTLCAFLILISLSQLPICLAAQQLSVTISLDKQTYNLNEVVAISGKVTDPLGNAVGDVSISILVSDYAGKSLYISRVYTRTDGIYQAQFTIPSTANVGTCTVQVTASKVGYDNGQNQFTCTLIPEFQDTMLVLTACLGIVLLTLKRQRKGTVFTRSSF